MVMLCPVTNVGPLVPTNTHTIGITYLIFACHATWINKFFTKKFFRLAAIAHRDWDGAFACAAPVHSTPGDQVLGFPHLSSDHW